MAKPTYHHGDLRRALLAAAADAITEHGVAALSMRDLARRAGVSHAAPTHHFGDKAGLLTALATEGFELLARALATSRLASNSFLEMGVSYVRFAMTRRAHFEVMFRPDLYHADDPDLLAARAKSGDALYAAVTNFPDGILATPLITLRRDSTTDSESMPADIAQLVRLVALHESVEVVVGLPVTLAGTESHAAAHVRAYAELLASAVAPVPVQLADERMSTAVATRRLSERGVRGGRRRAVVDQAAAVEILQGWLDAARRRRDA